MVDKESAYAANEDTKWNVNHPVNAEVQNGEDEQQRVEEHKHMVRPMTPFFHGTTFFFDVKIIQHQDPKRNGHMEARHGVVKGVVKRIKHGVPTVLVQQCVHAWNPRRCHFHVEEQIVRNGKCVNQEIVEGDLVGHVSVTGEGKIHGGNVDQEKVNKEVVEVEKFCQHVVSKGVLHPFRERPFNTVNPCGPVTRSRLHGFVEFVRNGLPTYDDNVSHGMEVIPLVVEFFRPRAPRNPKFFLFAREVPANDWREDHDHAHHDFIRVHGFGA